MKHIDNIGNMRHFVNVVSEGFRIARSDSHLDASFVDPETSRIAMNLNDRVL